jgi:RNA polymerase sigma factor (sigma-70 family)
VELMSNAEILIKNYYEKKKIQEKLKFEIEILKNNNLMLQEHLVSMKSKNDFISRKIEDNNEKILTKQIMINDIAETNANIEFIIKDLDETDREIIELRFKKNKQYQAMGDSLNMSTSTVSRKVCKIINKIDEDIAVSE